MTAGTLVRWAITLAIVALMVRQCRKPWSWIGRFHLWIMNRSHSPLTDWGLTHVPIAPDAEILDVGCGGGRTLEKLAARAPRGHVCGVDYSRQSVAVSTRRNAAAIQSGHVRVLHASVSSLPFAAGAFDLVTGVETHYYWPDLVADLREVGRVLKPGGRLLLVAEAYRHEGALKWPIGLVMRMIGAKYLTADEHRRALESAGYTDVTLHEEPRKGWICVLGARPQGALVSGPA